MTRLIPVAFLLVAAFSTPAVAQIYTEPDEQGCKDSSLLSRMPGCRIHECETKEFDSRQLWISAYKDDESHLKALEGRVEQLTYMCPEKLSALQIARNAENALRKANFTIVFSGSGDGSSPYVSARKAAQWIALSTSSETGLTWYTQTAVLVEEMKQDLQADASSMAAEIEKTGSVAVYGINFETGKAALTPDSEKVLQEVLTLTKQQPVWRFEVQGHTDNVGTKVANQALSDQRAAAVAAWLVKNGVDKARLTSKGYGDSQPVAPNTTEDGRAKNRRVELKKMP